jgi:hypothetical protein
MIGRTPPDFVILYLSAKLIVKIVSSDVPFTNVPSVARPLIPTFPVVALNPYTPTPNFNVATNDELPPPEEGVAQMVS